MNRILIIHRGSLGDFLLLMPSLAALRRSYPNARIELLGRTDILSLACPGIADSIASVERASLVPFFEHCGDIPAHEKEYFSQFDAVLAFISDPEKIFEHNLAVIGIPQLIVTPPFPPDGEFVHVSTYLYEAMASLLDGVRGSHRRCGDQESLRQLQALNTDPSIIARSDQSRGAGATKQSRPHADKSIGDCFGRTFVLPRNDASAQSGARLQDEVERRVESGGIDAEETVATQPLLNFREDELREADAFLKLAKRRRRPLIAIHPGSGSEKKCWLPERFEAFARELREKADCGLLIVLGPADERLVEQFRQLAAELHAAVAHNLPLRKLAAMLSRCSAYVGNDSGVTHLAAATGIPTVAVFGPTNATVWAPPGEHVTVIRNPAHPGPCPREKMLRCKSRRCLDIGVSQVFAACSDSV